MHLCFIKLPQVFGVSSYISAIYRHCLLVKNSFVNISEVNRQCLHSHGTRSENDFEKVSSTTENASQCSLTAFEASSQDTPDQMPILVSPMVLALRIFHNNSSMC